MKNESSKADKYNAYGSENEDREHWAAWTEKTMERIADKFRVLLFDGWMSEPPFQEMIDWTAKQIIAGHEAAGKDVPAFSVFGVRNKIGRYQIRIGPCR